MTENIKECPNCGVGMEQFPDAFVCPHCGLIDPIIGTVTRVLGYDEQGQQHVEVRIRFPEDFDWKQYFADNPQSHYPHPGKTIGITITPDSWFHPTEEEAED